MSPKNTICLWFNKDAEDAARFYAATFPDSKVTAVHKAPGDYPSGKEGDVLMVEFTVLGIPCLGLNGGPAFKQTEAFSFQVYTETQEDTDRLWNAVVGNDQYTAEYDGAKYRFASAGKQVKRSSGAKLLGQISHGSSSSVTEGWRQGPVLLRLVDLVAQHVPDASAI